MVDMPTKDVIYAQRPEGTKTKVSDAKFIQGRIDEEQWFIWTEGTTIPRGTSHIDLTHADNDSGSGTPIRQGTAHRKRKGEDYPRDSGAQKQQKSAESQSLGSTPQAHAPQQANTPRGNPPARVINLHLNPDRFKDFPQVLAGAAEKNVRAQGVFKVTLLNGRTLGQRATSWRPKSFLEYSCKPLGDGLSQVQLRYTKNATRIGGQGAPPDDSTSVSRLVKRQERRLASDSLSELRFRAGIPIRSEDDRERMGLPDKSPIHPLDGNQLAHTPRCIDGIHNPRYYETDVAEGTPFVMSLEECNLYSVHLLYEGRRVWICISPDAREKFEARLRQEIATKSGKDVRAMPCGQFARHERFYFRRSLLEKWGIEYTIVDQRAGEVVVTLPGTYHQGFAVGYTRAEVVNYADKEWAPSKLLWCDSSCPEYAIGLQDMHSDVVDARVPEASINRREDPWQLRNENRQDAAIFTNLGRSLTPYGGSVVWAYMGTDMPLNSDNELDIELDSNLMKKARLLQMILQCEWPGPGDIRPSSAVPAKVFTSVACIKVVRRLTPGLELVKEACLQLREPHQRALKRLAGRYGHSTGYFGNLLRQGLVLEQMADELGMHTLLTLPTEEVTERDFALAIDDGLERVVVKQPIKASLYYDLEPEAARWFIRRFPALRPHLKESESLYTEARGLIERLGIEPWALDEILRVMKEQREAMEDRQAEERRRAIGRHQAMLQRQAMERRREQGNEVDMEKRAK